jgi:NAD-dependent histone deacetylase SIR2
MSAQDTQGPKRQLVIDPPTVDGLAKYILEKNCRKILIMLGAGISVAAGIPDFRTPGTGLYSKLDKYNLAQPEEVFSIKLLREKPEIFYTVANDMQLWPGLFAPTPVHHLVKLLVDEGRVLRVCTQNIDTLERQAGVSDEMIVEAHGSFASAHCIEEACRKPFPMDKLRAIAEAGQVPRCETCGGIAKPDVVFFGEGLPEKFFQVFAEDAKAADLLIVIGTSLKVYPFASLASRVWTGVPRVLINNMRAGADFIFSQDLDAAVSAAGQAKKKKPEDSNDSDDDDAVDAIEAAMRKMVVSKSTLMIRDVFLQGDCQTTAVELAERLGLGARLQEACAAGKEKLQQRTKADGSEEK